MILLDRPKPTAGCSANGRRRRRRRQLYSVLIFMIFMAKYVFVSFIVLLSSVKCFSNCLVFFSSCLSALIVDLG